ncbi:hypothetical protein NDU88_004375 [Pleurodeles waltl]|uniref:Uncharacterized protein n=1 Tax=Pleurodeles waltl TaxID=8319 RepID=A0AAV7MBJ0_PLEWA|nr:hypothetical protein NDU88_004375 [Pleurodeles waltl]
MYKRRCRVAVHYCRPSFLTLFQPLIPGIRNLVPGRRNEQRCRGAAARCWSPSPSIKPSSSSSAAQSLAHPRPGIGKRVAGARASTSNPRHPEPGTWPEEQTRCRRHGHPLLQPELQAFKRLSCPKSPVHPASERWSAADSSISPDTPRQGSSRWDTDAGVQAPGTISALTARLASLPLPFSWTPPPTRPCPRPGLDHDPRAPINLLDCLQPVDAEEPLGVA